jgi:TolB-like protein
MKYRVTLCLALLLAVPVFGQRSLDDGIKDLADQLRTGLASSREVKLAVVPLRELSDAESVLGTFLAEELTTRLFTPGRIQIVERQQLDRVMTELKLQQSGAIDQTTARKVGQLTGADAVVTGTVTEFQSFVALNCRVIDSQAGRVLATGAVKIVKDDDLKGILAKPLKGSGAKSETRPPAKASPGKIIRMSYEFVDPVCRSRGDQIECTFKMTNIAKNPRYPSIHIANISGTARSYLIDSAGKRYPASGVQLGGVAQFMFSSQAALQPDLPTEARITFRIPEDTATPKTAAMCIYVEGEEVTTVVFKDVTIE